MTPELFTERLRSMVDRALVCYWNPRKERFVIDRCTHPDASSGIHVCSTACQRVNVMIVETDGKYRELADDLIGYLHSIDTWQNYGTPEKMLAASDAMEAEDGAKRAAQIDDTWKHVAKDDAKTLRKAFHLIQQHNTSEVH